MKAFLILAAMLVLASPATFAADVEIRGEAFVGGNWISAFFERKERDKGRDRVLVRYQRRGEWVRDWVELNEWRDTPVVVRPPVVVQPPVVVIPGGGNRHPDHHVHVGTDVLVNRRDVWVRATVVDVDGNRLLCRYDGRDRWYEAGDWKIIAPEPRPVVVVNVGTRGQALYDGQWYTAKILRVNGDQFFVSYDGYGDRYNQWITADRWRTLDRVPEPEPVVVVNVRAGTRGRALLDGRWESASVIKVEGDWIYVSYDDFRDRRQWITADRWRTVEVIRPIEVRPEPGISIDFNIGGRVRAEYDGQWYDATIIESKGGKYFVRYNDYGDKYNQWVPVERLRPFRR